MDLKVPGNSDVDILVGRVDIFTLFFQDLANSMIRAHLLHYTDQWPTSIVKVSRTVQGYSKTKNKSQLFGLFSSSS